MLVPPPMCWFRHPIPTCSHLYVGLSTSPPLLSIFALLLSTPSSHSFSRRSLLSSPLITDADIVVSDGFIFVTHEDKQIYIITSNKYPALLGIPSFVYFICLTCHPSSFQLPSVMQVLPVAHVSTNSNCKVAAITKQLQVVVQSVC